MPITIEQLNKDRLKGILSTSTYIRMCIATGRTGMDTYNLDLTTILGVSDSERFSEIATLIRAGTIESSLTSAFNVTWTEPAKLPTYQPSQILEWKNSGIFRQKGLLYFALAAENPGKSANQQVDPSRLKNFYKMTDQDIFGELASLTSDKTLSTNISEVLVRWLESKPISVSTNAEAIATLNDQLTALKQQVTTLPTEQELTNQVTQLASLINERPPRAFLLQKIAALQEAINGKQPAGDYQLAGDYLFTSSPKLFRHAGLFSCSGQVNLPVWGNTAIPWDVTYERNPEVLHIGPSDPTKIILDMAGTYLIHFMTGIHGASGNSNIAYGYLMGGGWLCIESKMFSGYVTQMNMIACRTLASGTAIYASILPISSQATRTTPESGPTLLSISRVGD